MYSRPPQAWDTRRLVPPGSSVYADGGSGGSEEQTRSASAHGWDAPAPREPRQWWPPVESPSPSPRASSSGGRRCCGEARRCVAGDVSGECWQRVTCCLFSAAIALSACLAAICVYYVYIDGSRVWLSDVRLLELPPKGPGTPELSLAVIARVRNPTKSSLTISSAALNISLVETLPGWEVSYVAKDVLNYPGDRAWSAFGNKSITTGPSKNVEVSLQTQIRYDWANVSSLVRSRCFGFRVTGDIHYSLTLSPWTYTTHFNRTMILFAPDACPCSQ
eukprot:Hpha_TRINITY_DN5679_c0_g1::TRINITY_DN5679_c0_g1_i1::g.50661::m.50661